ncbi:MAG TPA: hypothetical protein VGF75_04895 [Candidatus Saccharimonadales bacterium]|jgi:hypothetical protein
MSGPEAPRSQSYEELALREEIGQVVSSHYESGDFEILQAEDIYSPAYVIFAGKLRGQRPGSTLDIVVFDHISVDKEKILTIAIGDYAEYQLEDDGIISTDNHEFYLDEDDLTRLRFWVRETKWSSQHTKAILQK